VLPKTTAKMKAPKLGKYMYKKKGNGLFCISTKCFVQSLQKILWWYHGTAMMVITWY